MSHYRYRMAVRAAASACLALVVSGGAAIAHAQDPGRQAHWGVAFGFAPAWKASNTFKVVFDAKALDVTGSDVTVGAAHGSDLGGGIEILYIRKTLKDGSTVDRGSGLNCFGTSCVPVGTTLVSRTVVLQGLEVDKFVAFATIKRRVQIGLTAGGGIASVKGQADKISNGVSPVYDSRGALVGLAPRQETTSVEGRELFLGKIDVVPLGRVELTVAGIVAPGLKVKASGGFNFPGYAKLGIDIVYLISRH